MDETLKYRELFFEETDEYLQSLNDNLLLLEKDTESPGTMEEIFRSAHTLKGMAATMGYTTMTELTHHMENVLEQFKNGTLKVTPDVVSVIFKCLDKLSEMVEDLRNDHYPDYDIKDLLSELRGLKEEEKEKKKECVGENETVGYDEVSEFDITIIRQALEMEYRAYNIVVEVSETCMLKGARAYLVINKLEQSGEIIQTNPGVEDLEEGKYDKFFKLLYLSQKAPEEVSQMIENVAEIKDVLIKEISEEDLNHVYEMKEDTVEETSSICEDTTDKDKVDKKSKQEDKHGASSHGSQSIRVDISRLDNFMNLVSELVIYRTRLEELSTKYKATELNEPLERVH